MNTRQILGISIVIVLINVFLIYTSIKKNTDSRYLPVVDEYVKNYRRWLKAQKDDSAKKWLKAIIEGGAKREETYYPNDNNVVYGKKWALMENTQDNAKILRSLTDAEYVELNRDPFYRRFLKQVDDKTKPLELKNIDYYITDNITWYLLNKANLNAFSVNVPRSVLNSYRKQNGLPTI